MEISSCFRTKTNSLSKLTNMNWDYSPPKKHILDADIDNHSELQIFFFLMLKVEYTANMLDLDSGFYVMILHVDVEL